ncbi:MAG: hypothetical protein WCJ07_06535 [Verrucomicrobiota bacterium]
MKRLLEFFSPDRAASVGFILFLTCVPFFLYCRTHHFCMAGHLQDEVTFLDKANDMFWQVGFMVSIILSFRSGITFRYVFTFAMAVGFLLVASPLGVGGVLIFPVTGAAGLFALASLMGWID